MLLNRWRFSKRDRETAASALTPDGGATQPISTGHLPNSDRVKALVHDAYDRFKSLDDGAVADYIPALAQVPRNLFGICVVGTNGAIHGVGGIDYEFSIQSVSKPFVFALICQAIGEDVAQEKLGVNSTGLPFNSVIALERIDEGTNNPMVNAGAVISGAYFGDKTSPLSETTVLSAQMLGTDLYTHIKVEL